MRLSLVFFGLRLVFRRSVLALVAVTMVFSVVVFPYLEVRDRGLLYRGRLISWLNISTAIARQPSVLHAVTANSDSQGAPG